jgi:hypothetical protein
MVLSVERTANSASQHRPCLGNSANRRATPTLALLWTTASRYPSRVREWRNRALHGPQFDQPSMSAHHPKRHSLIGVGQRGVGTRHVPRLRRNRRWSYSSSARTEPTPTLRPQIIGLHAICAFIAPKCPYQKQIQYFAGILVRHRKKPLPGRVFARRHGPVRKQGGSGQARRR